MTEQEKQELNEKLAQWVFPDADKIKMNDECICAIHQDVGTFVYGLFTDSLDVCFEWLVPKACLGWIKFHPLGAECHITAQGQSFVGLSGNPPLALCLAIEELIDNGMSVY